MNVVRQRSKKKRKLLRDKYQKRWHRLRLKNEALVQRCQVVYFGEDEICEFELLEDYSKNDLKLLAHV